MFHPPSKRILTRTSAEPVRALDVSDSRLSSALITSGQQPSLIDMAEVSVAKHLITTPEADTASWHLCAGEYTERIRYNICGEMLRLSRLPAIVTALTIDGVDVDIADLFAITARGTVLKDVPANKDIVVTYRAGWRCGDTQTAELFPGLPTLPPPISEAVARLTNQIYLARNPEAVGRMTSVRNQTEDVGVIETRHVENEDQLVAGYDLPSSMKAAIRSWRQQV